MAPSLLCSMWDKNVPFPNSIHFYQFYCPCQLSGVSYRKAILFSEILNKTGRNGYHKSGNGGACVSGQNRIFGVGSWGSPFIRILDLYLFLLWFKTTVCQILYPHLFQGFLKVQFIMLCWHQVFFICELDEFYILLMILAFHLIVLWLVSDSDETVEV